MEASSKQLGEGTVGTQHITYYSATSWDRVPEFHQVLRTL